MRADVCRSVPWADYWDLALGLACSLLVLFGSAETIRLWTHSRGYAASLANMSFHSLDVRASVVGVFRAGSSHSSKIRRGWRYSAQAKGSVVRSGPLRAP